MNNKSLSRLHMTLTPSASALQLQTLQIDLMTQGGKA